MPPELQIRLDPERDETLPSYVDRLSAALNWPRTALLQRTGLLPVGVRFLFQYGISMPPDQLEEFARATHLEPAQVDAMLLSSLGNGQLGMPTETARRPHRWAYYSGSHACPLCLRENGAWLLQWKMPWCFACTRHNCFTLSHCPTCNERLGHSARLRGGDHVAKPGRYVNILAGTHKGGHGPPCGHPIAAHQPTIISEQSGVTQAQLVLDEILGGHGISIGDEHINAASALDDLQFLTSLLLLCGDEDDLLAADECSRDAFAHWRHEHPNRNTPRFIRNPRAPTSGKVVLSPHPIPDDPVLMAAAATTALHVLLAPDTDVLATRVAPLARRLIGEHDRAAITYVQFTRPISQRLADAILLALQQPVMPSVRRRTAA